MIALSMIVKPSDDEAILLNRCLKYVEPYVDEINITITGKNTECEKVCKKYKAKVSYFEWVNDFSQARNFNFSQTKQEYILWLDCDDVLRGAEYLRETVEKMKQENIDVCVMNYLYDFNDEKECIVKHLKSRIVKNGSVVWAGAVHEDFSPTREITSYLSKDIEVLHLSNKKRVVESSKRNLDIALSEKEKNPNDPRTDFLLANAYWGRGEIEKAVQFFKDFIEKSNSEEEKYLACLNIASLSSDEDYALKAIGLRPVYPNAYHKYAELIAEKGRYETAIQFVEIGLQLPTPSEEIIVFNPRDYDYNPLLLITKCYWRLGKYSKVQTILDKMEEMFPNDKQVKEKKQLIEFELGEIANIDTYVKKAKKLKGDKLKKYLDGLPESVKQHPIICSIRNENFIKKTSSGKDLVFYCSYTSKEWVPDTANTKGVGGSEESVIYISKGLAKLGWNVTVYNNCGKQAGVYDGVSYRPFWEYNVRDKQDVTILWRNPKAVDFNPNSTKVFVDLHDVVSSGEFYPERVKNIQKIFVKTKAHRDLFPNVSDEKFSIIPNGIDIQAFEKKEKKDPYYILNTSSPDRHLEATLDVFERLIEKQPDKPWKLGWFYGWDVFDTVHEKNKEVMAWKKKQIERFEKLKSQGRAEGGTMIGHKEIAKKYLQAGIFLYPTRFFEIHCISAVKAQAGGAVPITSDYAALEETVQWGVKVHEEVEKMGESIPELQGKEIESYVDAIINAKEEPMQQWAKDTYNWDNIINKWDYEISNS